MCADVLLWFISINVEYLLPAGQQVQDLLQDLQCMHGGHMQSQVSPYTVIHSLALVSPSRSIDVGDVNRLSSRAQLFSN